LQGKTGPAMRNSARGGSVAGAPILAVCKENRIRGGGAIEKQTHGATAVVGKTENTDCAWRRKPAHGGTVARWRQDGETKTRRRGCFGGRQEDEP
jgi:hypothetical protein